jgi:hypothetical protein
MQFQVVMLRKALDQRQALAARCSRRCLAGHLGGAAGGR